jgi:hypothetical protein
VGEDRIMQVNANGFHWSYPAPYVMQLLSLYSWFYKVTMLESTNAIDEGKM